MYIKVVLTYTLDESPGWHTLVPSHLTTKYTSSEVFRGQVKACARKIVEGEVKPKEAPSLNTCKSEHVHQLPCTFLPCCRRGWRCANKLNVHLHSKREGEALLATAHIIHKPREENHVEWTTSYFTGGLSRRH